MCKSETIHTIRVINENPSALLALIIESQKDYPTLYKEVFYECYVFSTISLYNLSDKAYTELKEASWDSLWREELDTPWSGFLMKEEELDRRINVLYTELSKLKIELSIDEFSKRVSNALEIPFRIGRSCTLIANNRFCSGEFYSVLINIKKILQTKMFCDVFDCCRAYGEEETYENAKKYIEVGK